MRLAPTSLPACHAVQATLLPMQGPFNIASHAGTIFEIRFTFLNLHFQLTFLEKGKLVSNFSSLKTENSYQITRIINKNKKNKSFHTHQKNKKPWIYSQEKILINSRLIDSYSCTDHNYKYITINTALLLEKCLRFWK